MLYNSRLSINNCFLSTLSTRHCRDNGRLAANTDDLLIKNYDVMKHRYRTNLLTKNVRYLENTCIYAYALPRRHRDSKSIHWNSPRKSRNALALQIASHTCIAYIYRSVVCIEKPSRRACLCVLNQWSMGRCLFCVTIFQRGLGVGVLFSIWWWAAAELNRQWIVPRYSIYEHVIVYVLWCHQHHNHQHHGPRPAAST